MPILLLPPLARPFCPRWFCCWLLAQARRTPTIFATCSAPWIVNAAEHRRRASERADFLARGGRCRSAPLSPQGRHVAVLREGERGHSLWLLDTKELCN